MTLFYSQPFEIFQTGSLPRSFHTIIMGSGYGAAMAALALAMREDKSYKNAEILVIERGNEYLPGDFPKTIADLPGFISTQGNSDARTGYADALFDLRVGDNVGAVVASGLGGTSLINAGVAVDPGATELAALPKPKDPTGWLNLLQPSRSRRTVCGCARLSTLRSRIVGSPRSASARPCCTPVRVKCRR